MDDIIILYIEIVAIIILTLLYYISCSDPILKAYYLPMLVLAVSILVITYIRAIQLRGKIIPYPQAEAVSNMLFGIILYIITSRWAKERSQTIKE